MEMNIKNGLIGVFNDYSISVNKNRSINIISIKNSDFYKTTVLKEIKFVCKNKNKVKEIKELLLSFEYNKSFFNKEIKSLSRSEKIILQIIISVSIGDILILKNIFGMLDKNNRKKVFNLLNEKKDKMIIYIYDDINILYNYTYKLVINNELFDTKKILTDVNYLIKNNISVPDLSLITYLAKKEKNIKLFYRDDVRDIIKDIYRHV